jgi:hypothetical protein
VVAAGVVLLFGSLVFTALLFMGGGSALNWVAQAFLPMASSVALLLGAGPSLRYARSTARATA